MEQHSHTNVVYLKTPNSKRKVIIINVLSYCFIACMTVAGYYSLELHGAFLFMFIISQLIILYNVFVSFYNCFIRFEQVSITDEGLLEEIFRYIPSYKYKSEQVFCWKEVSSIEFIIKRDDFSRIDTFEICFEYKKRKQAKKMYRLDVSEVKEKYLDTKVINPITNLAKAYNIPIRT